VKIKLCDARLAVCLLLGKRGGARDRRGWQGFAALIQFGRLR
jgi:hypothetical protein